MLESWLLCLSLLIADPVTFAILLDDGSCQPIPTTTGPTVTASDYLIWQLTAPVDHEDLYGMALWVAYDPTILEPIRVQGRAFYDAMVLWGTVVEPEPNLIIGYSKKGPMPGRIVAEGDFLLDTWWRMKNPVSTTLTPHDGWLVDGEMGKEEALWEPLTVE